MTQSQALTCLMGVNFAFCAVNVILAAANQHWDAVTGWGVATILAVNIFIHSINIP
jgi:hypothetical protein